MIKLFVNGICITQTLETRTTSSFLEESIWGKPANHSDLNFDWFTPWINQLVNAIVVETHSHQNLNPPKAQGFVHKLEALVSKFTYFLFSKLHLEAFNFDYKPIQLSFQVFLLVNVSRTPFAFVESHALFLNFFTSFFQCQRKLRSLLWWDCSHHH